MRTIPPNLAAHLADGATNLCHCWKLTRRDGTAFGFTDHDRDLSFAGILYAARTGLEAAEATAELGFAIGGGEVSGALIAAGLTEDDIASGLYDDASVETWLVNWSNVEERLLLDVGSIGEIRRADGGFVAEVRGLMHRFDEERGRLFRATCSADLGDERCGINLASSAYADTGTVTRTDGALSIAASGIGFSDGWCTAGRLTWTGGDNAGLSVEIKVHRAVQGSDEFDLWQRAPQVIRWGIRLEPYRRRICMEVLCSELMIACGLVEPPQGSEEEHSMKHYAGLDVSLKETSICIVDETGAICREMKVPSHPEDLVRALQDPAWRLARIGLEAGPLSQWLFSGLAQAGLPVVCIETRHTKAFLKAQVNKTDRNDARGIAQMMRVNLFRPVHIRTLTSQHRRALLTARKLLQEKAVAIENDIRGLLRNFGLKVGMTGAVGFEVRIRELVDGSPELADITASLLAARRMLREELSRLHRKVLEITRDDGVCRRLMTIPGVGPVVALALTSTIDVPARFRKSKAVGSVLGLPPVLKESGESKRVGQISLCGDGMMRGLLYEAAQVLLTRVKKWSWLKAWAMNVTKRRGIRKAIVALARRLAVAC